MGLKSNYSCLGFAINEPRRRKRGIEKCPPLSDLRESGSLEQDADCIIFLVFGEYEDGAATDDTVLFDIVKHRSGATDEVIAGCSMRRGFFEDMQLVSSVLKLVLATCSA